MIFTGREQLNVQKKKVNDDQNGKKKVYFGRSAENRVLVVAVFIFPLRNASENVSVSNVLILNMVKM